jgi:hypothetical protein
MFSRRRPTQQTNPTPSDIYFGDVRRRVSTANRTDEVKKAIEESGRWHHVEEWRIGTSLEATVEPVQSHGKDWFLVKVWCDNEFSCHTATIERAAEFVGIYRCLVIDMFYQFGWPSGESI